MRCNVRASGLRHLKERRGRIGEARALDRREMVPQRAPVGHAPEELHARVMGRGDLVRDHFLEARVRAGGYGCIQRRREDAGLGGRVRAVLGGIHADHGAGLVGALTRVDGGCHKGPKYVGSSVSVRLSD